MPTGRTRQLAIADSALSPDGHHLLVITTPKGYDAGRVGKMPKYVTESGFEEVLYAGDALSQICHEQVAGAR